MNSKKKRTEEIIPYEWGPEEQSFRAGHRASKRVCLIICYITVVPWMAELQ